MAGNAHITHFVSEKGEIKVGNEIQKEVLHFKKTGITFQKTGITFQNNRRRKFAHFPEKRRSRKF